MEDQLPEITAQTFDIDSMKADKVVSRAFEAVTQLFELDPKSLRTKRPVIPTGFKNIDEHTLGLWPGNLTIAVGKYGAGKSSFATTVALNAAIAGARVLFISLEHSATDLVIRMLANLGRIHLNKLYRGHIAEGDWRSISDASNRISNLDLYICDEFFDTRDKYLELISSVAKGAEKLLVVIDDITLFERTKCSGSWSTCLKMAARQNNAAILAVGDVQAATVDTLEDVLTSGLPYGSDAVDEAIYLKQSTSNPRVVHALIAKNHLNAPVATKLLFLPEYLLYMDYVEYSDARAAYSDKRVEEFAANLKMSKEDIIDALNTLYEDQQ